jgi:hypothetical protein
MQLIRGKVYYDKKHKEDVEFCYMGYTGLAIVCEPGDSGGGMQSCWGVDPNNLILTEEKKEKKAKIKVVKNAIQELELEE